MIVPLGELVANGQLREIPGVGPAIAAIIPVLCETGTHPMLEASRSDIPAGVLEMLAVPGLKPDKIVQLFRELDIRSLQQLEDAAKTGTLAEAERFGPAFQHKVLQGIEALRAAQGRLHMHRAADLLAEAEEELRRARPDLKAIIIAGDLRRGCELIGYLCLVATAKQGSEVIRFGEISACYPGGVTLRFRAYPVSRPQLQHP